MSVGTRALIAALGTAVVVVVFVVLGFEEAREIDGQSGGNALRNFIFDFQTLLTGVLALSAAWWTVTTMQATDTEANRRHTEAMDLALRTDRLAVERLIFPQLAELEIWRKDLSDSLSAIPTVFNGQATHASDLMLMRKQMVAFAESYNEFEIYCRKLEELLTRRSWKEGERFFGGYLRYNADRLESTIKDLSKCFARVRDIDFAIDEGFFQAQPWDFAYQLSEQTTHADAIHGFGAMLITHYNDVIEGLVELAVLYEFKVS